MLILLQLVPAALRAQGAAEAGAPLEDFGRWQHSLSHCRIGASSAGRSGTTADTSRGRRDCGRLRVDQQLPGLLSLRFISSWGPTTPGSRELVFAGVLERRSAPMHCLEGRCQPGGPLELQVTAVAVAGFDGQGLPGGVPRAILARGHCSLASHSVRCEASATDGERWSVEAEL